LLEVAGLEKLKRRIAVESFATLIPFRLALAARMVTLTALPGTLVVVGFLVETDVGMGFPTSFLISTPSAVTLRVALPIFTGSGSADEAILESPLPSMKLIRRFDTNLGCDIRQLCE
jgi:hypothetical protein